MMANKEDLLSTRSWHFLLQVMKDLHEKDSDIYPFLWNDDVSSSKFEEAVTKLRNIFGLRKNAASLLLKSSPILSMKECMKILESLESCSMYFITNIFRDRLSISVNGGACTFEIINALLVRNSSQELHDKQMRKSQGIRMACSFLQWSCREILLCQFIQMAAFTGMFCSLFNESDDISFKLFTTKLKELSQFDVRRLREDLIEKHIHVKRDTRSRLQILILQKEGWDLSVLSFRDGIMNTVQTFKNNYYKTHGRKRIRNLRAEDQIGWNDIKLNSILCIRNIIIGLFTWAISHDKSFNNIDESFQLINDLIEGLMKLILGYLSISTSDISEEECWVFKSLKDNEKEEIRLQYQNRDKNKNKSSKLKCRKRKTPSMSMKKIGDQGDESKEIEESSQLVNHSMSNDDNNEEEEDNINIITNVSKRLCKENQQNISQPQNLEATENLSLTVNELNSVHDEKDKIKNQQNNSDEMTIDISVRNQQPASENVVENENSELTDSLKSNELVNSTEKENSNMEEDSIDIIINDVECDMQLTSVVREDAVGKSNDEIEINNQNIRSKRGDEENDTFISIQYRRSTSIEGFWKDISSLTLETLLINEYKWIEWFENEQKYIEGMDLIMTIDDYISRWYYFLVLENRVTIQQDIIQNFKSLGEEIRKTSESMLLKDLIRSLPLQGNILKTTASGSDNELRYMECSLFNMNGISSNFNDLLSSKPFVVFRVTNREMNEEYDRESKLYKWNISLITKLTSHEIRKFEEGGRKYYNYNNVTIHLPILRKEIMNIEKRLNNDITKMEIEFHPISSSVTGSRVINFMNKAYQLHQSFQIILFGDASMMKKVEMKQVDKCSKKFIDDLKTSFLLNDEQYEASLLALSAIENNNIQPITCIQGPPGTGKTDTILSIISSILFHSTNGNKFIQTEYDPKTYDGNLIYRNGNEYSILVCAASNNAITNIEEKVLRNGLPVPNKNKRLNVNMTRIYAQSVCNEEDPISLTNQLYCIQEDISNPDHGENKKNLTRTILQKSVIVFTTLSTACSAVISEVGNFDVIIVDEATQATEPDIVSCIISSTSKSLRYPAVILVGDQNQLPPVIKSSRDIGFNMETRIRFQQSLFERLLKEERCSSKMLKIQYRIYPMISKIHSKLFYENKVNNGLNENFFQEKFSHLYSQNMFGKPILFVDTKEIHNRHEEQRYINRFEAEVVMDIVQSFIEKEYGSSQYGIPKIGIITPYRQQADYIQSFFNNNTLLSKNVIIGTVDSMQGQERDVILYSSVRSNNFQPPRLGFINDKRRINVAISRSKAIFIFVGDSSTICIDPIFYELYSYCTKLKDGYLSVRNVREKNRLSYCTKYKLR